MRRIAEVKVNGKPAPQRRGFTLIELMIVIVVIATLLALLLPAVSSVFRTARDSQVQMEIRSLEQAIASFKTQFGIDPPSQIKLFEARSGWVTDPVSVANIRSMWPRFDFDKDRDINLDTDMTDVITLRGAECLVFFLGGMRAKDTSSGNLLNAVTGFSRNPGNPFSVQALGEVRDGPFFEFKTNRLVPSNNDNSFLVYIDSLNGHAAPYAPYFYASSYEGRGYSSSDLVNGTTGSTLSDVYRLSSTNYINPKTFQIISPGVDHMFGSGGIYTEASASNTRGLASKADYDNLTNFHNGRLNP